MKSTAPFPDFESGSFTSKFGALLLAAVNLDLCKKCF